MLRTARVIRPTLWASWTCAIALVLGAPQLAHADPSDYPPELDPNIAAVFDSPNGQAVLAQIPQTTGDAWLNLFATTSYRAFQADLIATQSSTTTSSSWEGGDSVATSSGYSGPVPSDPQCVKAINDLTKELLEAGLTGLSEMAVMKIGLAVWAVKRYCYPWRKSDEPPVPDPPLIRPPASDDRDHDCRQRWDVEVPQRPDDFILLRVDYGDGAEDWRSIPPGTGSVTLSFSHQYLFPPPESKALEVLRVTNTTTGGEAFGFFMHWGPTTTTNRNVEEAPQ